MYPEEYSKHWAHYIAKALYIPVCFPPLANESILTFALDVKLDNVLVNYSQSDEQLRFTDVNSVIVVAPLITIMSLQRTLLQ